MTGQRNNKCVFPNAVYKHTVCAQDGQVGGVDLDQYLYH